MTCRGPPTRRRGAAWFSKGGSAPPGRRAGATPPPASRARRARQRGPAGVLWVSFAFAGTLGLNRSMAVERDRGCLDGLLLAPVDRSALYFGKALGNLAFMLIVEAIVLPTYSVLYNTNLFNPGMVLVILLGSIGYVVGGTLLSALAGEARTRG